jgi:acyl transferase domain-containing protein/acyl carrier protein
MQGRGLPGVACLPVGDLPGDGSRRVDMGFALDGQQADGGGTTVFVFSGHGSQWQGMARELSRSSQVFAERLHACVRALEPFLDSSLHDFLEGPEGAPDAPRFERVDIVQPALFAVTVSLAALWRAHGVRPAAVVGHSQGEIAAAHVAGGLSLEDAARIVALRSRALAALSGTGGLLALALDVSELDARLRRMGRRWRGRVGLAAVNGPASVALYGDLEALEQLTAECRAEGISARRVRIDYPAHSPAVEAIRAELLRGLSAIVPRTGDVPFYSTVTGGRLDTAGLGAEHWYRAERQAVQFAPAIDALLREGHRTFIEVSPHPVLTVAVQEAVDAFGCGDARDREGMLVLGSLRRGEGTLARLSSTLAEVQVRGSLRSHLAGMGGRERAHAVLELVRAQVTITLGLESPETVDGGRAFKDLGLDSAATVELLNRLKAATGLHLTATLLFDEPTPRALAAHLLGLAGGGSVDVDVDVDVDVAPSPLVAATYLDEPIAIVGMACRYPGGVRSAEQLWELVAGGGDAISAFPADRGWDLEGLYDPDPDRAGFSYVREGGFLHDAAEFDAEFFGIGPREALAMDPQQRLLLEVAWEALEDAGIDPLALRDAPVGVFAGAGAQGYGPALHQARDGLEGYTLTGTAASVLSGRLAYAFGLAGPAVTVDTACSSSLVALHMACQSLRQGECTLALAGGVTVMADPGMFVEFSRQRGLARDGRCKPFAAAAEGTAWSEGAGVVLVERLSDAQRLGHRVLGVVRGSAINQDGASNGLTAPSGLAQQRVIAQALANARLSSLDVDAVEAHGTGTTLGDPIEAQALGAVYGQGRPRGRPLRLGSLKSNIGHTQGAAGVAGVIKMVMAMRHGVLPRTLHVDEPSRHVDWSAGSLSLLLEQAPWEREDGGPRRAGVSSFGISGTNAHVILEEAPGVQAVEVGAAASGGRDGVLGAIPCEAVPWVLSARGEEALLAQARRLSEFVGADPELDVADVGFSLAGRSRFAHRALVIGDEREGLLEGLQGLGAGGSARRAVKGVADLDPGAQVVFLFPGQGSQWQGMAAGLLESSPVFASELSACAAALDPLTGWSLEDVLRGVSGAPRLERVDVVQPALFAVMVALAGLWRACGVEPSVVVGHSQGEIAAAHVAGGLTLQDAARLVVARSRALVGLMGRGGMLSVALGEREIAPWLARFEGALSLAAVNSPGSVVVSGEREALDRLSSELAAADVRARELPVGYASHSPQIEEIRAELLAGCEGIVPVRGEVPMLSSVTGEPIDTAELDGDYWYRNLREAVCFEQATRLLLSQGARAFLEISPHPVLTMAVQETAERVLGDSQVVLGVGSLRREEGGSERFLTSLGEAWVRGVDVNWRAVFAGCGAARVPLPSYAFQRKRYWFARGAASAEDVAAAGLDAAEHPLLGASVELADGEGLVYTGQLSLRTHPWLSGHAVMGTVLLPGAAFVELALHAGREVGCEHIEELTLGAPLVLRERGAVQIQLALGGFEERTGRRLVSIHSRAVAHGADGGAGEREVWTVHANGVLCEEPGESEEREESEAIWESVGAAWPPAGADVVPIDLEHLYERLAERGYDYGPAFQGLRAAWRGGDEVFAEVALPVGLDERQAGSFGLHPALLDAALHPVVAGLLSSEDAGAERDRVLLPFSWSGVSLRGKGGSCVRVRLTPVGPEPVGLEPVGPERVALALADEQGAPIASVRSLALRAADPEVLEVAGRGAHESLLRLGWQAVARDEAEVPESREEVVFAADELDASGGVVALAHEAVGRALESLRAWLADEDRADARLIFLTRGAMAVLPREQVPGLALAPVWGLVRAAQSEHPGRFVLVDIGPEDDSAAALRAARASAEPQLAVRDGALFTPRLERASERREMWALPAGAGRFDPHRTVLITGGTGDLGALVARHLIGEHGVRSVLLLSRRGREAPGALALEAELGALEGQGARVRIASCDVSQRDQLAAALELVPEEYPLGGVVHAAGVLDDGVVASLTPERLQRVLAPKLDAAWHLHELTEHLDLSAFVLFSSIAATLGSAGQANYAAANVFLDALAAHRRARGLAGMSLEWGLWAQGGAGMTGGLGAVDLARMRRMGVEELGAEEGLELFDLACASGEALLMAARFDPRALRDLVRGSTRGAGASLGARGSLAQGGSLELRGSLARRLAGMAVSEREAAVLELVCSQAALVLGHVSAKAVDARRTFKELGFDSLAAVELRNRLAAVETGLRLPVTAVFDHPTPLALAGHLLGRLAGAHRVAAVAPSPNVADEPIAIVGMSCRYPGGVRSPEQLWELLAAGGDAISAFPSDRGWELEGLGGPSDPDPDDDGAGYVHEGGFLYDAGEFDARFFAIGPHEALAMDPQQRLLLESSWEAFEDARIDPASLRGSRTGVFAGVMHHDYAPRFGETPAGVEGYRLTGESASVVSGRVAYSFGLEGPAVTVDTACSSSLVALHWACQSLRLDECSLALVGGVTVMATPWVFVEFARQRGLARDGRCKSFAQAADGTAWSEGVGMVVLERLCDARRLGHDVLAVVRGSAVNQDGASNGLTAPNGPSQQRVIARALANAGLAAVDVDAVEAHGTGTTLGDPIEAQALLATYGQGRLAERPLWLGSVKSNIGHTQAAAGMAGVIKMVMAMRHGALPRTLHVDEASRHVDWSAGAVSLLTEEVPWEADGRPRRAGVSSFGISGTNAHVILEEAPGVSGLGVELGVGLGVGGVVGRALESEVVPWVLSGRGREGLRGQAEALIEFVGERPELDVGDVALSLSGRPALEQRAVALGGSREELLDGLGALARGEQGRGVLEGAVDGGELAFLFTGQGSQRVGMGRELYESCPAFARAFDEVCGQFDGLLGRSLREVVFGEDESSAGLLDETLFTQAGLFALEVGLSRLLRSWGVRPAFLIGHSIGELVAAHVADVFSLEDACRLVLARGRLMGALPAGGAMVSVQASEEEMLPALAGLGGRVALAAVNGPASVVVSGDEDAVLGMAALWEEQGRGTRRLRVSHAFHSPRMEGMLEEFSQVAASVAFAAPRIPIVSNVTGELVSAELVCSPEYWVRHVRETVRFGDGVRLLADRGVKSFLELGPAGVLSAMVADCLEGAGAAVTAAPLLRGGHPQAETLLGALASVWVRGAEVDWERVFAGSGAERVALPGYAFQRERFWFKPRSGAGDASAVGQLATGHPLLGACVRLAGDRGWLFTGRLALDAQEWLADHAVLGTVLLPGTAFVELALRAGTEVGCPVVRELVLEAPLALAERGAVHLQVSVGEPDESGLRALDIYSCREGAAADGPHGEGAGWTRHASGVLAAVGAAAVGAAAEGTAAVGGDVFAGPWPPPGAVAVEVDDAYERLAGLGLDYGPAFQGLRGAWRRGAEVFAELALSEGVGAEAERFGVHPALLDAGFHAVLAVLGGELGVESPGADTRGVHLPFSVSEVELYAAGARSLRACLSLAGDGEVSLTAADESGRLVVSARVMTREVSAAQIAAVASTPNDSLFCVEWMAAPTGDRMAAPAGDRDTSTDVVLVDLTSEGALTDGLPGEAHEVLGRVLERLQSWLADERFARSRMVFLTQGAVATAADEGVPGLALAGVWGLVRSAQSEHPGRFALIDLDRDESSRGALPAALACDEPQLAVRAGAVLMPRLTPVAPAAVEGIAGDRSAGDGLRFAAGGTVLVTGGTGGLGSLLARHLVERHGVRHLLLTSRRGMRASGARELAAELHELGAEVAIETCDVSHREQLAALIAALPKEHALTGVVHTAGLLDDGVIASLTGERIQAVLAPKVDGAWHLHELTKHLDLRAFVLFSSIAGVFGSPGQGSYAAGNAFLDALAAHRRSLGLAGLSLAWGQWAQEDSASAMTAQLEAGDLMRLARSGVAALPAARGLELFDAACAQRRPLVVPVRLQAQALRAQARQGVLPPLLRRLVRAPLRRALDEESLARRLAGVGEAEREGVLLEVVRSQMALVLGQDAAAIDSHKTFRELGFDSLSAVELRNRLSTASGLRLGVGLLFDHPTPAAVVAHLSAEIGPRAREGAGAGAREAAGVGARGDAGTVAQRIDSATAEEIFELIDSEMRAL